MGLLNGHRSTIRAIIWAFLVSAVDASHFAGGIFMWAPTGNGTEIKVDFRLSWNRDSYFCNDSTISSGGLIGEGLSHCFSGCSASSPLQVHCTDFSETDKWSSGRNSFKYIPSQTNFSFGFTSGNWISLKKGGGSWSLKTTADVSLRSDTNRINSSPTVEMSPIVALQHGCQHTIILPVSDADGDVIRCRFADGTEECAGVCGAFSGTLISTSCVLQYTANEDTGWYAVAVQIEDFLSASSTTPLSSVSLQFLVKVFNSTDSCGSVPIFVSPTPADDTCFPISANEHFTLTVVAFTNSSTSIKSIDTVKNGPSTNSSGFANTTGNYMRLDANWTPTLSNAGSHAMCFSATDNNELRSEQRCVHLYVEAKPKVVDVRKTEYGNFIEWELIYDKGVERPDNSTYIFIFDDNGTTYDSLDATSDNVTFGGSYIRIGFKVDLAKSYYILLQEGVVLGGCKVPSDAMDNKTRIIMKSKVKSLYCNHVLTQSVLKFPPGENCLSDLIGVSQCLGAEFSCRFDTLTGNFRCLCSPELILEVFPEKASCLKKSGYGGSCLSGKQCTTFLSECIRTGVEPGSCGCPLGTSYNKSADECTTNAILFCPAGQDQLDLWWNKTRILSTVYQQCPAGSSGQVIRYCLKNGTFSSALYNCTQEVFRNLTDQILSTNITTTKALESLQMAMQNSSEIHAGDVDSIETILTRITDKEANETTSAEQLKQNAETFFEIADMLTDPETSGPVWESKVEQTNKGVERFIETIDRYSLILAPIIDSSNETKLTIQKENLVVLISKVSEDQKKDLKYPDEGDLPPFNINRSTSFILRSESFSGQTDKVSSVVVVVYRDIAKALPKTDTQQTHQSSARTINSQVLSIQLLPKPPQVLNPPIQLVFSIDEHDAGYESQCSFWETPADGSQGGWSTRGCVRTMANATSVQCSCNHLTNFAILTSPIETPAQHQVALTVISLTGCGVSIVCLVITLILHASYWRVLKGDRNVLAMAVCSSLLLAYLLFVFGVTRTSVKGVCTTVAVLLHYSFLLVFFLLLAEGIYMALQVVLPFHKKSHLKELLIGAFAIPAVFVLIVASATELHSYGNDKYCWLTVNSVAFWMFVGPALLVIVFNLTIIILIMKKMYGTKWIKDMNKREQAKTLASKTMVMLPVMGVTWLFGILSVHESAISLQYLFVIFNSFQGLFIFLFHCVMNKQLRGAISKSRKQLSTLSEESSRSHGTTDHSCSHTTITHVEPPSTVTNDVNTDLETATHPIPKPIIENDPSALLREQFKKRHAIPLQTQVGENKLRRPPTQVFIELQIELRDRLRNMAYALTSRASKMFSSAQQDTTFIPKNVSQQSLQQQPLDDTVEIIKNGEENEDNDFVVSGGVGPETLVMVSVDREDDIREDCKEIKNRNSEQCNEVREYSNERTESTTESDRAHREKENEQWEIKQDKDETN